MTVAERAMSEVLEKKQTDQFKCEAKRQSQFVFGAYKDYFEGHVGEPSNLTAPPK
jgi:hypothetical protein